jgi:hypothetical protein
MPLSHSPHERRNAMNTNDGKRQSVCCVCGKRLSAKAPGGAIQWQTSHIGDKGLYCDTCYTPGVKDKAKKKPRP